MPIGGKIAVSCRPSSYDAAVGGVEKYMKNYYEFPTFCEKVLEFIVAEGGFVS